MDRRGFLKSGAAGIASGALGWGVALARAQGPAVTGAAAKRAKNLIFMVSDGMSFGTLTLAELASLKLRGQSTNWVSLFERAGVRRCSQGTSSANSLVTDSAAAASAWGSGEKINNGAINITPLGVQRLPILVQARQNGLATGVVSTARVTHATPAGFYSNCPVRSQEREIAQSWLDRGVDIALGGGAHFFTPGMLDAAASVRVVRTGAQLTDASGLVAGKDDRVLGLFADSHVPFELDRRADVKDGKDVDVPTLAAMSRFALERLASLPSARERGFAMQIEGGRIDHAAHNNDAGSLVAEQLAFDDAIGTVLEFLEGRDDTLLVITTDHGNANPGISVYEGASFRGIEHLVGINRSFDWIFEQLGAGPLDDRMDRLPGAVERATGVRLKPGERDMMGKILKGERVAPFDGLNIPTSVLGGIIANATGVGFVSGNHTSDQVELTVLGPGSERFPGEIENHQIHAILVEALDLKQGHLLPGMEVVRLPKPIVSD